MENSMNKLRRNLSVQQLYILAFLNQKGPQKRSEFVTTVQKRHTLKALWKKDLVIIEDDLIVLAGKGHKLIQEIWEDFFRYIYK